MMHRMRSRTRSRLVLGCGALLFCILLIVYSATSLYPELSMVATSECTNPLRNWNGKAMGVRVGTNYLDRFHRPPSHNIHSTYFIEGSFSLGGWE